VDISSKSSVPSSTGIISTKPALSTQSASISSAKPSSTRSPAVIDSAEELDAAVGGKQGNPGARIRFGPKALDAVYQHATKKISETVRSMKLPEANFPIGAGVLSIKSANVSQAKFEKYQRELQSPNQIRSRLYDGYVQAIGEWKYKEHGGAFVTTINNVELNATSKLERAWDGRPQVTPVNCKADLSNFRVEIEGYGQNNSTVINQCDNYMCRKIQSFYEELLCNAVKLYIKDVINDKFKSFPIRVNLGPVPNQYAVDYRLLQGSDQVKDQYIQQELEGKVLSRGISVVNFHPADLAYLNSDKSVSFSLGDIAFNSLLRHVHAQQYPFSAKDLLSNNSAIVQQLTLNCSNIQANRPKKLAKAYGRKPVRGGVGIQSGLEIITRSGCLGDIFDNESNAGQFSMNSTGDLVFKTQRPLEIYVQDKSKKSRFYNNGGYLEIYEYDQSGSNVKPDSKLILRADVKSLRGEFIPKLNRTNITGSVAITKLELAKPARSIQGRAIQLTDPLLIKLSKIAQPILTQIFNKFLDEYAQFPLPIVDGYACEQAQLQLTNRTMQLDCEFKVLPHATRKG